MSRQNDDTYPWDWEGWSWLDVHDDRDYVADPSDPQPTPDTLDLPYDGDDWPVVDSYAGITEDQGS